MVNIMINNKADSNAFTPAGALLMRRHALLIDVEPAFSLGECVIGASDVPRLLDGGRVPVHFVQPSKRGPGYFVGECGDAWISKSKKAINFRIGRRLFTTPMRQVRDVVAGRAVSCLLSAIGPDDASW